MKVIRFSDFRPKINTCYLGDSYGICKMTVKEMKNIIIQSAPFAYQFEPIELSKDKDMRLCCDKMGLLYIAKNKSSQKVFYVSGGEYTLYRYYCFLSTLFLWQELGAKINAPIIFDDLFSYLDESIDKQKIIEKAKGLKATIYFDLGKNSNNSL